MNTYKHRAALLTEQRAALARAADHATTTAERAHKRGDKTTAAHALETMEAIADAMTALTQLLTQLRDEITTTNTERTANQ